MLVGTLIVLLVVVTLLAIPVTLLFRVSWPGSGDNDVRLRWAFGLVDARVPVSAPETRSTDEQRAEDEKSETARSGGRPQVLAALRNVPFRRRIGRFVRDLWRSIHKQDVRLRVRLGLGDPADTGQLWALMGPVSALLSSVREVIVNIEPDFDDTTVEVDGSGAIRIVPLRILYLGGGLLVSPSFWRGARLLRGS